MIREKEKTTLWRTIRVKEVAQEKTNHGRAASQKALGRKDMGNRGSARCALKRNDYSSKTLLLLFVLLSSGVVICSEYDSMSTIDLVQQKHWT